MNSEKTITYENQLSEDDDEGSEGEGRGGERRGIHTLGSILVSIWMSLNASSNLPRCSSAWHLLNKALESFTNTSNAKRKHDKEVM